MSKELETHGSLEPKGTAERDTEYDIDPLFLERWSPRAMTGETLPESAYLPLFDAARWAPSSYNNQHWRFLYATRESDEWGTYLDLLFEQNQAWASQASLLVAIVSKTTYDHNGEEAHTHSFDSGAAWQNLALEGARRGLVVHAMAGFDRGAAREALDVPDGYDVEVMLAVGEQADPETLPEPMQEREGPSGRKPLDEVVAEGTFDSLDGD
jgi:nitroreductase